MKKRENEKGPSATRMALHSAKELPAIAAPSVTTERMDSPMLDSNASISSISSSVTTSGDGDDDEDEDEEDEEDVADEEVWLFFLLYRRDEDTALTAEGRGGLGAR